MVFSQIFSLVFLLCSFIWFLSNLLIFLIHYFFVLIVVFIVISKFVRLKSPSINSVNLLFNVESQSHCVAYQGASLDVPENSRASLEYVCAQKCPSALFNLDMTADEQLVVLEKQTLEQAKIHQTINKITFDEIKDFNIAERHPLGKGIQGILTLDALIKLIEASNVNVIFLSKRTDLAFVEKLRLAISTHEALFSKRIVFCSQSPITIFKLRKHFPFLICGLWMDSLTSWKKHNETIFKLVTILRSLYSFLIRNIIIPTLGISLVFIHKDEFNAHIHELWKNNDVTPIVYFVNSASEKRYFQSNIKVHYLTGSLRSEPSNIIQQL